MKDIVSLVALAGSGSLLNACSAMQNTKYGRIGSNQEIIETDDIIFNDDPTKIHVCHMSEEEGIERIIENIANGAKKEESWLYVHAEKLWVEVGLDETICTPESGCEVVNDTQLIHSFMRRYDRLTKYHTHPLISKNMEKAIRSGKLGQDEFANYFQGNNTSSPSPKDIKLGYELHKEFRKKQPKGIIDFGILVPYGVSRYQYFEKEQLKGKSNDLLEVEVKINELYVVNWFEPKVDKSLFASL